jgi:hypothetical protein
MRRFYALHRAESDVLVTPPPHARLDRTRVLIESHLRDGGLRIVDLGPERRDV